jgi:dUTP pyrophosphatase
MKERKYIMKIKLSGGYMPIRAHEDDAGLDLFTPENVTVPGCTWDLYDEVEIGSATIDTLVHVAIPKGYVGYIKSKSGLMVKHGLTADGTIDSGYTGSIRVKLFNHTAKEYTFKKGDKIAQLVIHPIITPELELVDELEDTDRGSGGFGSTGR